MLDTLRAQAEQVEGLLLQWRGAGEQVAGPGLALLGLHLVLDDGRPVGEGACGSCAAALPAGCYGRRPCVAPPERAWPVPAGAACGGVVKQQGCQLAVHVPCGWAARAGRARRQARSPGPTSRPGRGDLERTLRQASSKGDKGCVPARAAQGLNLGVPVGEVGEDPLMDALSLVPTLLEEAGGCALRFGTNPKAHRCGSPRPRSRRGS